jgi:DNA repair protein RadC
MKVDYFTIPEITVSYKDDVKPSQRFKVEYSADIAKILAIAYKDCMLHHEEFQVLFLNNGNRVLGISNIAKGGTNGVFVDLKFILQTALKVSASSLIISHNHPSGNMKATDDDLELTKKVKTGCEAVGIKLLDHVIMTEESYYSFSDERILYSL